MSKTVQYADLGKKAKDVLTEKYLSDSKVDVKGRFGSLAVVQRGPGDVRGEAEGKYSHGSSGVSVKAKHETGEGRTKLEVVLEGGTLTAGKLLVEDVFRGDQLETAKFAYSYADKSFAAATTADAHKRTLGATLVLASPADLPNISLGAEAVYDFAKAAPAKTDLQLAYATQDLVLNASLTNSFDTVGVSVWHDAQKWTKCATTLAAEFSFHRSTGAQTFTAGWLTNFTAYNGQLRVKANQAGKVDAVAVAQVHNNATLSVSASATPTNAAALPKVALGLTVNL